MPLRNIVREWEMWVRPRAPKLLRKLYRMSRTLTPVPYSKPLPQELLSDCHFCASRLDMIGQLPSNAIVAELGTYRGEFAREILKRCTPKELHVVDIEYDQFDHSLEADPRLTFHHGLTTEVIRTFPDNYFDWIYIDAGHDYGSVLQDAQAAAAKVKPDGYLAFNDFAHVDVDFGKYGVHRAVVDFAVEKQWPFHLFAYEAGGLYDVTLKKPLSAKQAS